MGGLSDTVEWHRLEDVSEEEQRRRRQPRVRRRGDRVSPRRLRACRRDGDHDGRRDDEEQLRHLRYQLDAAVGVERGEGGGAVLRRLGESSRWGRRAWENVRDRERSWGIMGERGRSHLRRVEELDTVDLAHRLPLAVVDAVGERVGPRLALQPRHRRRRESEAGPKVGRCWGGQGRLSSGGRSPAAAPRARGSLGSRWPCSTGAGRRAAPCGVTRGAGRSWEIMGYHGRAWEIAPAA